MIKSTKYKNKPLNNLNRFTYFYAIKIIAPMKKFFKNIFSTVIGILISIFLIIIILIGFISISISSFNSEKAVTIKENSILLLDLSELIVVERTSNDPLDKISSDGNLIKTIELKQLLDNIEKATHDNNIKAIYINTSFVNAGLSQTEEIRNKLLEFKKSGKKIIAYSETYSQIAYYLSSVATSIYLNPEGMIELKGLSISTMFYKGLLEKLDVDMQIIRHGKFKSAIEPFVLEKMSPENKEQMRLLINSFANNLFDSIANQRNIPLSIVEKNANQLILSSAKKCLELSYVDALLYQDQVENKLKEITENNTLKFININKYSNVKVKNRDISRNKIALIYATGNIKSGKGDEQSIGSKTTVNAIRKASDDKNVKGIVLRINSGGGSALASEIIWRETILAKAKKPLIVSMGDYAASGGYYIACAADSIVANPTSLTGSIGVFGMIPNLQKFYKNKIGITIDTVNTNKYSDMGINRKLYDYEKRIIQNSVENIYSTFISRVSNGRNITKEIVNEIGQGRVWSGYNAKDIGLIDTYGGIYKAIEIAAELADLENYRVISLPKKRDPFSELALKFGESNAISRIIFSKIGLKYQTDKTIKELIRGDKIQARIPYIIELK